MTRARMVAVLTAALALSGAASASAAGVSLTPSAPTVTEPSTGTTAVAFTATSLCGLFDSGAVTYDVVLTSGSAGTDDYGAPTKNTVTVSCGFLADQIDTFSVPVKSDDLDEATESFGVELRSGATTADSATVSITDAPEDTAPAISIGDATATEGTGAGTTQLSFPVTLSKASGRTVTASYAATGVTATAGTDFTAAANGASVTFAPGETSKTILVDVTRDAVDEGDETLTVGLSGFSPAATAGDTSATGTITDDDAPTFAIDQVRAAEGDSGTKSFTFTVTLSAASQRTLTVHYRTADTTDPGVPDRATAGDDYTAIADTTLTFAPGDTQKTFSVSVAGDHVDEPDEAFDVELSQPSAGTLAATGGLPAGVGRGTIVNDDAPVITIDSAQTAEGDTATKTLGFAVHLSTVSARAITVHYRTAATTDPAVPDRATAGTDYTAIADSTLTFAPGETQKTIDVTVAGDTLDEADEAFDVELSQASAGTLGATGGLAAGLARGTIANDDLPTVTVDTVSAAEGQAGATAFGFAVRLSNPSDRAITVRAQTTDAGTTQATAGSDYAAADQVVTIPAGDTQHAFTVAVAGDRVDEADETFGVVLSAPSRGTLGDANGLGAGVGRATILNDDLPSIAIRSIAADEGDTGTTTLPFAVTLSNASDRTITVHVRTADSPSGAQATAGTDYTALGDTVLTFAAGETQKAVPVAVAGDIAQEADETFDVVLSLASRGTLSNSDGLGAGVARATIRDDDAPQFSVDAVSADEGNSGTTPLTFTVRLRKASPVALSVHYRTRDAASGEAATAGQDYAAIADGVLTFAPGDTQRTFTVAAGGDTAFEADEVFDVVLSQPSAGTVRDALGLGAGVGRGTIRNDDAQPTDPGTDPGTDTDTGSRDTPTPTSPSAGVTSSTTTAPVTPKPSGAGPAVTLSTLRFSRGKRMTIALACPTSTKTCRATLSIFTVPNKRSKLKDLRRELRLGSRVVLVPGGSRASITLNLSRKNQRLVRRARRVSVKAFAVVSDNAGRTSTATRTGTLRR